MPEEGNDERRSFSRKMSGRVSGGAKMASGRVGEGREGEGVKPIIGHFPFPHFSFSISPNETDILPIERW
jgi:hypothetical protein